MGSKPSNAFQMNRPESGGADRDELREKSGLLEREKQEFAASEKATKEAIDSDQDEPREGRADAEARRPGTGSG
jgi:hypothetical protein